MTASKTIYVDIDGKQVKVIGDTKKQTIRKKQKARKALTPQEDRPKSIDPQQVREQRKQEQKSAREQYQKQMMTEDYAYTDKFNTKGPHSRVAEATAKGVRIARRGGGRAYGKNS